jgi:two-component system response regulator YesN
VTQFEKMAHATPSEYRNSLSIGDESERAGE